MVVRSKRAPFFHALVVAGAGLSATECGGISTDQSGRSTTDGTGGSRAVGAGGDGGSDDGTGGAVIFAPGGTSSGSGGSRPSGGAPASGGRPASGGVPASGGTPASGGAPDAGAPRSLDGGLPDPGTIAQWDCSGLFGTCSYLPHDGTTSAVPLLNSACPVDPSRPKSAKDCKADDWFDCTGAVWEPDLASGRGVQALLVNCTCTPKATAACDDCPFAVCDDTSRICGCAHPVILR